jgi:hypothetical protein
MMGEVALRHTPSPSVTQENRWLLMKILKSMLGEDTKVLFEETTDFPVTPYRKRRFAMWRVVRPS